ncbi:hypothetical protein AC1031_019603 [Aphanomyces cochlioides]|nr:hypothetical protein AC1031_019603 [Aphanomyces cochlioides]
MLWSTSFFVHDDDVTPPEELKVKAKFEGLFENPVKGFLGIMPLDYWRQVLLMTNKNAHKQREASSRGHVGGRPFVCDFSLGEMMKFIGTLIMMSVVRAGEYRLYWQDPERLSFFLPGAIFAYLYERNLSFRRRNDNKVYHDD